MKAVITATVYGRTALPESWILPNGDLRKKEQIQLVLYHIQLPDKQILVDSGCDTMPGFTVEDFVLPPVALRINGINAEDITDVIITHAHHDHIDGLHHFPNATIHIQQDEYLAGKGYFPQGAVVHTFEDNCSITDCVSVEKVGGHTIGSSIVKLEANGKHYVFCGDECYLRVNLQKRIPTATSFCPEKSRRFVEEYSKSKYTTILGHDPQIENGEIL